jgi:serine/threonine-protein kinase
MAEDLATHLIAGRPRSGAPASTGGSKALVDGRYRLLERLGSGASAAVYRAEDLRLGRKVALKLLHQRFADDPEFVVRFRREASSAACFDDDHIVSVYDIGQWDGTYYIAMEYVGGRSLRSIIRREAPLEQGRAIALTTQLLHAARSVHGRGIIHRDFKPDNAILDSDGRLKITDFGIARTGVNEIAETGAIIGTAQYMSPEQAQGTEAGPASDLYSIGIILHELLTARVPFEGETVIAVALQHVKERPRAPSVLNTLIAPQLDAIVMKALEKEPRCRFEDAEAFINALDYAKRRGRLGWRCVPRRGGEPRR